jgi:AraC-like DNA-binding protein
MLTTPTADTWRERIIPDQAAQAWLKDVRSRFIAVSEAFADACGVTPDDMIGKTEEPFFSLTSVERFRSDDRRAIAWGRLIVVLEGWPEDRFRTFKAPVLDESGRVAGTVGLTLPATGLLSRISPTWLDFFSPPRDTSGAGAPTWLRRVRRELDVTFNAPVSVTALASKVGRDPAYLTRAFRQRYGVTPVGYAHRHRAEWIARALATSALPLSQLAQEAGFTDQSHMTRLFARYFGITPAAYRDAMRTDCRSKLD